MRKCPEWAANRYRMILGRKVNVRLWAPLLGAITGSVASVAMALGKAEPAARLDPRVWLVATVQWSAFAFLLVF